MTVSLVLPLTAQLSVSWLLVFSLLSSSIFLFLFFRFIITTFAWSCHLLGLQLRRFKGVLSAAVKGSETVDTLRGLVRFILDTSRKARSAPSSFLLFIYLNSRWSPTQWRWPPT